MVGVRFDPSRGTRQTPSSALIPWSQCVCSGQERREFLFPLGFDSHVLCTRRRWRCKNLQHSPLCTLIDNNIQPTPYIFFRAGISCFTCGNTSSETVLSPRYNSSRGDSTNHRSKCLEKQGAQAKAIIVEGARQYVKFRFIYIHYPCTEISISIPGPPSK